MFRIGEFSKLTQVTSRMLRYYDEMGLLKPEHIDKFTGYRLYSVEQIPVLNKILYLRDSGFNVNEIAEALKNTDNSLIVNQLDNKYKEIEKEICDLKEKLNKIEIAKKEILYEKSDMHYNVSIKSVPSYKVLSYRKIIPNYYAEGQLWQEMSEFSKKHKIEISEDTFSIYYDTEYKETNVDVEVCAPVKRFTKSEGDLIYRDTESVPTMACTMVYGNFSNISGAYLSLARWLQNNKQYKMTGYNRQIIHRGPWNETNPDKYLVEIQIPIEKIK